MIPTLAERQFLLIYIFVGKPMAVPNHSAALCTGLVASNSVAQCTHCSPQKAHRMCRPAVMYYV